MRWVHVYSGGAGDQSGEVSVIIKKHDKYL